MLSDFFVENTSTSIPNEPETPKFGEGFDVDSRITARKVANESERVFKYYEERFKQYDPKIDGLFDKINELSDKVNIQGEELKNARADNTKSLAVFVAFFTFVSISFTILPRVSQPLVLLGIILVLLASLTFFVLLLVWALADEKEQKITWKQKSIFLLFIVLLVIGLISSYVGYQDMKNDKNEENNNYYTQNEVDDLLGEQKKLLKSELQKILSTDNTLLQFKVCIATQGLWPCLSE